MYYKRFGGPKAPEGMFDDSWDEDLNRGTLKDPEKGIKDSERTMAKGTAYELPMYNNIPGESGSILVYEDKNGVETLVWA
jgi:hypothetical protein